MKEKRKGKRKKEKDKERSSLTETNAWQIMRISHLKLSKNISQRRENEICKHGDDFEDGHEVCLLPQHISKSYNGKLMVRYPVFKEPREQCHLFGVQGTC